MQLIPLDDDRDDIVNHPAPYQYETNNGGLDILYGIELNDVLNGIERDNTELDEELEETPDEEEDKQEKKGRKKTLNCRWIYEG